MRGRKAHLSILSALAIAPFMLGLSSNALAVDLGEDDYLLKLLGKYAFFDTNLSNPQGSQACASCHDSAAGGSHPDSDINAGQVVANGATGALGFIRTPTNTYASLSPPLQDNSIDPGAGCDGIPGICGGNFWNARAQGRRNSIHAPDYTGNVSAHIGPEVCQGLPDTRCTDRYIPNYEGPISDQALNPFNPVEQNIERWEVCERVRDGEYAELYRLAWGVAPDCRTDVLVPIPGLDVDNETPADISFKRIAMAIGAAQHAREFNPFTSRRDLGLQAELRCLEGEASGARWVRFSPICRAPNYLNSKGDFPLVGLNAEENLGHDIFYNIDVPIPGFPPPRTDIAASNCAFCHANNPGDENGAEPDQIYSDQAFHNLGVPLNPDFASPAGPDMGLAGMTGDPGHIGFFRTQTTRNLTKAPSDDFVKAYMHNGYFKTLEGLVNFYNTSKVKPQCPSPMTEAEALAAGCWPEAEWPTSNIAPGFLVGALGMSASDEAALVAYMKTLDDITTVPEPLPYSNIRFFVRFLARIGVVN